MIRSIQGVVLYAGAFSILNDCCQYPSRKYGNETICTSARSMVH
jgi:hypothetical protein